MMVDRNVRTAYTSKRPFKGGYTVDIRRGRKRRASCPPTRLYSYIDFLSRLDRHSRATRI